MAKVKSDVHQELARLGAIARLDQIERERQAILAAFPNLRRKGQSQLLSTTVDRQRRTISPKGRKAMSAGMRRYWAKRRATAKGKSRPA